MKGPFDSRFWKQEIASPASLKGTVKVLPENSMQLGLLKSCGYARPQQLIFIHKFLFCPFVPSYVNDPQNEGGVALERVLASAHGFNWWAALIGQFRIQKYFTIQRRKRSEDFEQPADRGRPSFFKTFLNQSLYAAGFFSKISLGSRTSILASSEASGTKKGQHKALLRHKLQNHDITMDASWNEKYIQMQGASWDLPLSLSLNLFSNRPSPGLQYAFSICHNSVLPKDCNAFESTKSPSAVVSGLRAKSTILMEGQSDIWKSNQQGEGKPYNLFNIRPHVTLAGLIGASFDALFGSHASIMGLKQLLIRQPSQTISSDASLKDGIKRPRFSADLFASVGCSMQLGNFQKTFFDLTKVETRFEIGMPSKLVIGVSKGLNNFFKLAADVQDKNESLRSSVVFMLQQQVAGPLCARVDSRLFLDELLMRSRAHTSELAFGLDYSLPALGAAKVVAWYSPTLEQGMVEFRLLHE
eukprot:TRINITY_DN17370_c0_g2_i1.p1 TRINITY_DN17370_c0_g2~~TRINITY_DN17370_c0_g2_i1.p1  ORF type:complete len:471 (+),score=87.26 TRINITY_DN17370_c0_g2_i1:217-1629(+)